MVRATMGRNAKVTHVFIPKNKNNADLGGFSLIRL